MVGASHATRRIRIRLVRDRRVCLSHSAQMESMRLTASSPPHQHRRSALALPAIPAPMRSYSPCLALFLLLLPSLLPLLSSVSAQLPPWQTLAPMLIPRSDFQVQAYGSVFYVHGGCVGNQTVNGGCPSITNRLESYDTQSNSWAELTPSPTPRTQYSAAMVGSRIYYVGGRDLNGNVLASVDVYDVQAEAWSTLPDQLGLTNRSNAAAFAINGVVYVTGGYDNDYNSLNSTIALNTSSASASPLRFQADTVPAKPVSAGDCGGVSIAGFGYVFAGFSSVPADGFCFPLSSIERYSPASNSWTLLSPASPMQNRGDPAYAVVSDLLFVMGGEGKLNPAVDCFDGSSLSFPINSVEFFNVSSGNWTPVTTDSLPMSRFRFSGNTANSRIITSAARRVRSSPTAAQTLSTRTWTRATGLWSASSRRWTSAPSSMHPVRR